PPPPLTLSLHDALPISGPAADPLDQITGRELVRAVDEELARLPDRLRLPVLLCGVQGLTRDEAARRLGWTAGAVKGRLERGRRRDRKSTRLNSSHLVIS